uniref:DUF4175 domain-containing protein n=1 Tax=Roseihalotalea indica TaxID=2867963 RepID=A0AA49GTP4_9BACT|nr:DUF4175 domain-containing protein [Tunicatimonas sp. TK19036]
MKLFLNVRNILLAVTLLVSSCSSSTDQENKDREAIGQENDHMMSGNHGSMMGEDSMMDERMQQAMMSGDMDKGMMENMRNIHQLLINHEQIQRRVENLDNGVKTWTESSDPEIAKAIRVHVRQMKSRVEGNRPIRQMDPLFREIFEHAGEIEIQIEDTENGVYVLETSDNPQVVKLIQQHANRAVSEFVEQGMSRAMESTPLPEGYEQ